MLWCLSLESPQPQAQSHCRLFIIWHFLVVWLIGVEQGGLRPSPTPSPALQPLLPAVPELSIP